MTEATCRRELDLEIPAEDVQKAVERVAQRIRARGARAGIPPGQGAGPLIRRRFADDIKGEVLQSLVPEQIEKAVKDQNLTPITQPHVDQVDYAEDRPLKFRADLRGAAGIRAGHVQGFGSGGRVAPTSPTRTWKRRSRNRASAPQPSCPSRAAPLAKGDFAQLKLVGTPADGGEPLEGRQRALPPGRGRNARSLHRESDGRASRRHRSFDVNYPADYPDQKLAGKKYTYAVEVLGIKEKKLPELNDEFAKDISDSTDARRVARQNARRVWRPSAISDTTAAVRDALLAKLVAAHDFPVPEALVENQMDVRLERAVRIAGGARRGSARGERGLGSHAAAANTTARWKT